MTEPAPDDREPADRWVRLDASRIRDRLFASVPVLVIGYLIIYAPVMISRFFIEGLPFWAQLLVLLGVTVVVVGLFVLIWTAVRPIPAVNFALRELKMGRRRIGFDEIDSAVLVAGPAKNRPLSLQVGKQGGILAFILLRKRNGTIIEAEEARALIALLEASAIRVPSDPYDPTGSFSRYNFPGYLTREQAIDLVQNVPAVDEPLPKGVTTLL